MTSAQGWSGAKLWDGAVQCDSSDEEKEGSVKVYIIQEDGDTVVKALPNRGSAEAGHDSTFAGGSPQEMAMTERQQFDAQWKDRPFRARTLKLFTKPLPWQQEAMQGIGGRNIQARIEDDWVFIFIPDGDVLRVQYSLTKGMQKKRELLTSNNVEGELDCKHWIFSTRVTQEFTWQYQPVDAIAVNVGPDSVDIGDEEVWPANSKLLDANDREEHFRSILWDREEVANTRQRRGVRRKIKKANNRRRSLLVSVYERILALAESRKLLLSIVHNSLATELVKLCENRAVPFVIVSTPDGARELGRRIWEEGRP
jgi:hypothetical protein